MSKNIFISYDHDDQNQVNGFKLLNQNTRHPLDFQDHSLKEPVLNRFGSPNKYPPSDPRSENVRRVILSKFQNASKLVVLIGFDTADSEWVDWEVRAFFRMKERLSGENTRKRIRGMMLKGCESANSPYALLGGRATEALNWDPVALDKWLDLDPDKTYAY